MKIFQWIALLNLFLASNSLLADEELLPKAMQKLGERFREFVEDDFADSNQFSPLVIAAVSSSETKIEQIITLTASTLKQSLDSKILVCDPCNNAIIESGESTIYESNTVDLAKVHRIYQQNTTQPKAVAWIDWNHDLLSIRIVDFHTGEVIFASTIDPNIDWNSRSMKNFSNSRLRERQARGEAIIHRHIDIGLLPLAGSPHIGWSLMQQWGITNQYLSGLSLTFSAPTLGFGINWFRVLPQAANSLVGFKVVASLPQLISKSFGGDSSSSGIGSDPAVSVIGMIKYPIFGQSEQFYINAYLSSSGSIVLGLSF